MINSKSYLFLIIIIIFIVIILVLYYAVIKAKAKILDVLENLGPDLEKWRIPANQIEWKEKLGSGAFGIVKKAIYNGQIVAAKSYNKETMKKQEFLHEAHVMTKIKHDNIVQILGICYTNKGCFIILEYMCHGDLEQFLQKNKNKLTFENLLFIAMQIALAMKYLESNNIIHRDIAARNCLVGENLITKIADFGLTRQTTYAPNIQSVCATRWCAPENWKFGQSLCATKSDVFSYGILLIEIFTCGDTPYSDMIDDHQVFYMVKNGGRMKKPRFVPECIYKLMLDCCEQKPNERPSFDSVYKRLEEYNI